MGVWGYKEYYMYELDIFSHAVNVVGRGCALPEEDTFTHGEYVQYGVFYG